MLMDQEPVSIFSPWASYDLGTSLLNKQVRHQLVRKRPDYESNWRWQEEERLKEEIPSWMGIENIV